MTRAVFSAVACKLRFFFAQHVGAIILQEGVCERDGKRQRTRTCTRAHADNMLQLQVALECFKTKRVSSCDSPLSSPPLSFTFQGAQITSSSATVRLMESRSCDLRQSVSPLTSRFFFYLSSRRLPPPALCWTLSAELTERHVGSAAEKLKCNFKGVFDVFFFFPALHLTSCFLLAPASLQLWAVFLSLLLFVRVFREVCLLLWRV